MQVSTSVRSWRAGIIRISAFNIYGATNHSARAHIECSQKVSVFAGHVRRVLKRPVGSLKFFRSVCKHWLYAYYSGTTMLCPGGKYRYLHPRSCVLFRTARCRQPSLHPFVFYYRNAGVLGFNNYNGLWCLFKQWTTLTGRFSRKSTDWGKSKSYWTAKWSYS